MLDNNYKTVSKEYLLPTTVKEKGLALKTTTYNRAIGIHVKNSQSDLSVQNALQELIIGYHV